MHEVCKMCKKNKHRSCEEKKNIIKRLNVIEGQIRGIKQMVEDDRYCSEVIMQLSASMHSLKSLGNNILTSHMKSCMVDNIKNDNNIPDLNNTSDTIKNWYTALSTADKMITIIAKKDNENYAKYKTDVSSVAENNKIDLSWIDYETLTETDLKYLSNSYGISNINDFMVWLL